MKINVFKAYNVEDVGKKKLKIEYDKTYMKLFIDNIEKINISDTVDFSTCKPFYYALGTDIDGGNAYTSTTFDKPDRYAYIRDDA